LLAYEQPKSSITRLKKGDYNLSKKQNEILWKKKLCFRVETEKDLHGLIDSLKNVAKRHQEAQAPTVLSRSKLDKRTLYIPLMSDHAFALSAAFTACGVDTQVIPESDEETLQLGRKYTSGRECYPCILTTGDIIKMVKSPGFDPSRSAFFMPSGRGPCRFGLYNRFHKLVLEELGYGDVPVFAPVQDETLYENFDGYSKDFSRLAWIGVVAVDLLSKKLRETRPYELCRGTSDEVYQEFLHKVCSCIKGREDILSVLKEARMAFDDIRIDRNGIVETYVTGPKEKKIPVIFEFTDDYVNITVQGVTRTVKKGVIEPISCPEKDGQGYCKNPH